jgi:hypothetical protein
MAINNLQDGDDRDGLSKERPAERLGDAAGPGY